MPPGTKRIKRRHVLPRLRIAILQHKPGWEYEEITAFHKLRGRSSPSPPGLGFDKTTLGLLTKTINAAFADVGVKMAFSVVANKKKIENVRQLSNAIWKEVLPPHRDEEEE